MNAETHPSNPPIFNLPTPIVAIVVVMIIVHALRVWLLSADADLWVVNVFAFVPYFYAVDPERLLEPLALYWTPISHGFLHADWTHLLINLIWMAAFGSAVARRFGAIRFFVFFILATAAGALAHYIFHVGSNSPVVGASGAVSACMGAAVRFAFVPGMAVAEAVKAPAQSLLQSLTNRSIMTFVVIWFLLNWLLGSGVINIGVDAQIAWEAHMGGFIFGWLAFGLFDRHRANTIAADHPSDSDSERLL